MCVTNLLHLATIFILVVCGYCSSYEDKFYEELLLKPLHSQQLYAYFQFSTLWDAPAKSESCKYN